MTRLVIKDSVDSEQYFDSTITDEQKILVNYVKKVGQSIREKNNIKEDYTYDFEAAGNDELFIFGRLYMKIENEGEKEKFTLDKAQIHLVPGFSRKVVDFTADAEKFSFFRGEIIAAKGKLEQNVFRAEKVFTDCRTQIPAPISGDFNTNVLFVRGPYFKTSLDEASGVNESVLQAKPDLVVYLGPFMSDKASFLVGKEATMTAETAYKELFKRLSDGLDNCIFVSNLEDALSIPVFPTRPMIPGSSNYQVVGDPTLIQFGQAHFFITSVDVFKAMASQWDGNKKNRPQQFLKSLIVHNTICPVNSAFVQADHIETLVPQVAPHFIITPSIVGVDGELNEFDIPSERDELEDQEAEAELKKKEDEEKAERIAHNQYTTSIKFNNMAMVSFKNENGAITRSVTFLKKTPKP